MLRGWGLAAALRAAKTFSDMASSVIAPPPSVRGMTVLDRSKFTTSIVVPALRLGAVKTSKIMPVLKKYLLKIQKFKPVQNLNEDNDDKVAYLDPQKIKIFEDIGESEREILKENNVTEILNTPVTLGYENWRYDEIFKAVLPEDIEAPNAYSKVGHLVHLNLRDNLLPHKNFIGDVLLDKVAQTRTVVNKLNTIDSTYRHFAMEVIAGEKDTMATVSENGCRYKFDFAKVYWNPRLSTEHQTLVSFLNSGDVLYDVFAGVGPFSVPAARKGCKVLANDLNPESFKWLKENFKLNKTRGNFEAFNKDGREFIREDVKRDIMDRRNHKASGREHISMNLPALATEFLDVFRDWLSPEEAERVAEKPPTVHLYCFVKLGKDEDPVKISKLVVEDKLGSILSDESLVDIRNVRNVSPNKEMMRVSFLLTRDILRRDGNDEEPTNKKARIERSDSIYVDDNVVGKDGEEQVSDSQDEKCLQGRRSKEPQTQG